MMSYINYDKAESVILRLSEAGVLTVQVKSALMSLGLHYVCIFSNNHRNTVILYMVYESARGSLRLAYDEDILYDEKAYKRLLDIEEEYKCSKQFYDELDAYLK